MIKRFLLVLVTCLVLGACGAQSVETIDSQTADSETTERSNDSVETQYPLTVTDDSGVDVTVEKEPERIVSILPSVTEIAFALGLDDEIIAVTDNDDYPEQVHEKEKVGGMELNVEKIVALEPDLVLAGLLNGEVVEKLRDLGLTVLVSEGESLEDTYASIELIGNVTNRVAEAKEIVSKMQEDVRQVEEWVSGIPDEERVNVWLEVSPELYTAGAGTSIDELISIAGGKNVAAEQLEGWGQLSEENVVALNPDVIVGTYAESDVRQAVADRSAWSDITAVKENRVYGIEESLLSRPGPRLTEGLRRLAELFYPDEVN